MEPRLLEFEKNILLWYPFKENTSLLYIGLDVSKFKDELDVKFNKIVSIENVEENSKFDYITIIEDYSADFENKINNAKKYLKEDGKLLIAVNNKFGVSNLNSDGNIEQNISESDLKNIFKINNLENSKFYYVFPSYKYANLIYTDEYNLTEEDISRNFAVYNKDAIVPVNENRFYTELLKEGKTFVNKFANSFFIEVSNKEIDTTVKYVSYANYRKKEYRVMTIIENKKVVKKSADKLAIKHIKNIKENSENLEKCGIEVIENFEEDKLVSEFIKTERFDVELAKVNSVEEFVGQVEKLKDIYEKELISYNDINPDLLKDYIKNYNKEKLEKLHFVKKAYIDFIPKNIFIVDGKIKAFDQEWIEEYVPVEYIYYRLILNTPVCLNRFGKEKLFEIFKCTDYIDLFVNIENNLREKTFDMEVHDIFFRQYNNLAKIEQKIKNYEIEFPEIQKKNIKLEEENHNLNLELDDARNKVNSYANQLRIIENSRTWKLLNILRKIAHSFKDRINSVKANKAEKNRKKEIINHLDEILDKKTKKYWLELSQRYKDARRLLENTTDEENTYALWMKANDCTESKYRKQVEESKNFTIQPKISILVPLYNTPMDFFRELLFAVYFQSYSNWELCLADGSPKPLKEIENMCKDPRVKYYYIGENKGISGNTNEALKLATGDYISLFDHDDMLPLNSLFEIVRCINENPDVEFIYTDEDKLESIDKLRYDPYFKPDYAPDTLRSGNYITHFSTFKKELMEKIGGFRSKCDGAQDYDIILRATELAGASKIRHIPSILYHWRIHPLSTAMNSEAKTYAYDAGVVALQDHLDRTGIKGDVTAHKDYRGYYLINYEIDESSKVNIYIINKYPRKNELADAIESIINNTSYENYEIDIIDITNRNLEIEEYYTELQHNPKIKVLHFSSEFNYSQLMNNAINSTKGDFIVEYNIMERINTKNWIQEMMGLARREDSGIVGARIVYARNLNAIKHIGIVYGVKDFAKYMYQTEGGAEFLKDRVIGNVSCVTSLFRMYRREIFNKIIGMDETIIFQDVNEVDFSLRIRKLGLVNIFCPNVEIIDCTPEDEERLILEKDSIEEFEHNKEIRNLKENWKVFFDKYDPYYSINFNPVEQQTILRVDEVKY